MKMAAPMEGTFDAWLSSKLTALSPDIDLEVFVSYITGILETDTPQEEKVECITELLSEVEQDNLEKHCEDIIKNWDDFLMKTDKQAQQSKDKKTIDQQVSTFMVQQESHVAKTKQQQEQSDEEKARKAAILAQYGVVFEGEEQEIHIEAEAPPEAAAVADDSPFLCSNFNALKVSQRERDLREQSKQEHERKKQKDKEDREKQKAKAQERKDAEKKRTQKGERRR